MGRWTQPTKKAIGQQGRKAWDVPALRPNSHSLDKTAAFNKAEALTFTWSCGDEAPGEGTGLLSPTNKRGVGAVPLQGLAG